MIHIVHEAAGLFLNNPLSVLDLLRPIADSLTGRLQRVDIVQEDVFVDVRDRRIEIARVARSKIKTGFSAARRRMAPKRAASTIGVEARWCSQ